jgi:hypothetical protein
LMQPATIMTFNGIGGMVSGSLEKQYLTERDMHD